MENTSTDHSSLKHLRIPCSLIVAALTLSCAQPVAEYVGPQQFADFRADAPDYIFVHGGPYDGAAWGQEVSFLVTPDDRVQCVFIFEGHVWLPGGELSDPDVQDIDAYDEIVAGAYQNFERAIGPPSNSGAAPMGAHTANYLVEISKGGVKSWRAIGIGEGDGKAFDSLDNAMHAKRHECWAFG
ncbi:hypothetical protein [Halovulum sp. GXIMD14793]